MLLLQIRQKDTDKPAEKRKTLTSFLNITNILDFAFAIKKNLGKLIFFSFFFDFGTDYQYFQKCEKYCILSNTVEIPVNGCK